MLKDPTGIMLIILGILFWIKPFMVAFIKLQNTLRGSQTNITSLTLWYYRVCGLAAIAIGCILFFGKK